jgi:[ribosomal protein S18]-alanine N-acetyltransferase
MTSEGNCEHREEKVKSNAKTVHASNHRNIRMATLQNLEVLVSLEAACFSVPWSKKNFEAELGGNEFSRILFIPHPEYGLKVQAIGYICAWIVFEEIRFLNLAIHAEFRRQGLATQLIREAIHLGSGEGCCRGMLEVRESNHAAKKLYESFHFQAYATRKSYYTNPTEDAILMTLEPLTAHIQKVGVSAAESVGSQASIHRIS